MRIAALALAGLASLGFMSTAGLTPPITSAKAEKAVAIPPSTIDVAPVPGDQVAVLAGGCFWGVEAVFEGVKGVRNVTSGYAGGGPKPQRPTIRYPPNAPATPRRWASFMTRAW